MKSKKAVALSDEQMRDLEKAVCSFDDSRISSFAKKAIIWMLRQSKNLTREISLKFPVSSEEHRKLGIEFAHGVHDICGSSGAGKMRIDSLIKKFGGSLVFFGYYSTKSGLGAILALDYDHAREEVLPLEIDEIKAIELD